MIDILKRILFAFVFFTISCDNTSKCQEYKKLNPQIEIKGWDKEDNTVRTAYLLIYNDNAMRQKPDSVAISNIINFHKKENYKDEVLLNIDKDIKTSMAYRLVINDTIKYDINNFVIENTESWASTKKIICSLKSYNVNNKVVVEESATLSFDKSYGKLY